MSDEIDEARERGEIKAKVEEHGRRIGKLESRWDWTAKGLIGTLGFYVAKKLGFL